MEPMKEFVPVSSTIRSEDVRTNVMHVGITRAVLDAAVFGDVVVVACGERVAVRQTDPSLYQPAGILTIHFPVPIKHTVTWRPLLRFSFEPLRSCRCCCCCLCCYSCTEVAQNETDASSMRLILIDHGFAQACATQSSSLGSLHRIPFSTISFSNIE